MDFDGPKWAIASAYAYNKPEGDEPNGTKHLDSRKHRESAKSRIGAVYTLFWNLFLRLCARFDIASVFRYNLKNS